MSLPRVGAPKKNEVGFFDFAVGTGAASRTENRRQTGDAGGVSSPIATIDVVATDHRADKLLRDVVEFVGGFGAAEHAEGARSMLGHFTPDTLRNAIESFFPCGWTMRSTFADQGSGQPFARSLHHGFTSHAPNTGDAHLAASSRLPQMPNASKAAHEC